MIIQWNIYFIKTAAVLNKYPSNSSLDNIVKNCSLSNNNYYILYNELNDDLKNKYTIPILYKNGIGKYNKQNILIKEFTSKLHCVSSDNISDKSLTKSLQNNIMYGFHYYKNLDPKVECILNFI